MVHPGVGRTSISEEMPNAGSEALYSARAQVQGSTLANTQRA